MQFLNIGFISALIACGWPNTRFVIFQYICITMEDFGLALSFLRGISIHRLGEIILKIPLGSKQLEKLLVQHIDREV